MGLFGRGAPPRRRGGVGDANSLTASAERIAGRQAADTLRRISQPWQQRAFAYYDLLGEIKYAAQFYSRALANLRLFPAEIDENGDVVESQDPADRELLDRIQDPGGGQSGLLSAYGRLMFLTGEATLFVTHDDETGMEQWEMLSSDELRVQDGGRYLRYKAPSMTPEGFKEPTDDDFVPVSDDEAVAYRLWQRHPRYSMLADSTMQGVLDLCVAEGSLVNTMRGPVPIEEVTTDDHVFTWSAGGIEVRPVARCLERGKQSVVKVTAGRRTIRATAEHPVLVLRKDKPGRGHRARYECEWVEAGSLEAGDHLVALDHVPDYGVFQEMPDGTPIYEDVAWFLGQIVGDGHVHAEGVNVSVYNEARAERIRAIAREWWGLEDHPQGGNVRFYSRALRTALQRMGLRVKSHRKRVPAEILASPPHVKRAFLAGYEEADGHLTKQGWQSLATSSADLARDLRGLYLELGENVSNVHVQARAAVMAMPGGHATENAKPLHRFQVYYGSRRRGAQNVLHGRGSRDAIGGEHFTLATVKSVVPDGTCRTYDLEVDGEHNYIADGVVSHNCEELVILTHAVRSRARSRLAGSGILAVSDGFSSVPLEPVGDEDPEVDIFVYDLVRAMTAAITDEGSASAVVPLVVRGPLEEIKEGIRHIQIVDPTQLYPETGLRYECIKRIAIGLDMPPEILLGMMDANHWTGWMIDEQSWKAHLQPKAQQLVDDLTSSYYRPQLRENGDAGWQRKLIGYDASAIINHPDRTKDAKDLYDKRAIGKRALREAGGFDEEDAPDQNELAEMVGIATRDSSLAWYGVPSVRGGTLEPEAGVVEQPGGSGGTPQPSTGGDVEPGPPPEPDETEVTLGSAERILGAADLGIARAREVAGNRLRSLAKREPEALAAIEGVRAGQVAHALGPDLAAAVGAPAPIALVQGARDLVLDALRMQEVTGAFAEKIADSVEVYAARTLFQERPGRLPASFGHLAAGANGNGRPLTPA